MENAKEEFLKFITNKPQVVCAEVKYGDSRDESLNKLFLLPIWYLDGDFKTFIDSLDFKYDNLYGGQNLFGTIWFVDGTWASRGEYDGSEWWEYNKMPEIPINLRTTL